MDDISTVIQPICLLLRTIMSANFAIQSALVLSIIAVLGCMMAIPAIMTKVSCVYDEMSTEMDDFKVRKQKRKTVGLAG